MEPRKSIYDLFHIEENSGWLLTLGDMTTLLLTFFVFLIGVSVFKTDKDYQRFWKVYDAQVGKVRAGSRGEPFGLISGLKVPRLDPDAEAMLDEMTDFLDQSDTKGIDLYYNETRVSLRIAESLGFPPGEFAVTPAMEEMLGKLVPVLQRNSFELQIEGHTDPILSPRLSNTDLSLKRALAVARVLIRQGVAPTRLSVAGYGSTRPVSTEDSEEGRRQNRRVEIQLIFPHH